MTLDEWLNSYTAAGDAALACSWRKRAWRVLRPCVEKFVEEREAGVKVYAFTLFDAIEVARAAADIPADGKRWKQELDALKRILRADRELWPTPTADDRAAAVVAQDLVELHRYADAIALVREQIPHATSRKCPTCGAPMGQRCLRIEWDERSVNGALERNPEAKALDASGERYVYQRDRIVPHEARLT